MTFDNAQETGFFLVKTISLKDVKNNNTITTIEKKKLQQISLKGIDKMYILKKN